MPYGTVYPSYSDCLYRNPIQSLLVRRLHEIWKEKIGKWFTELVQKEEVFLEIY